MREIRVKLGSYSFYSLPLRDKNQNNGVFRRLWIANNTFNLLNVFGADFKSPKGI